MKNIIIAIVITVLAIGAFLGYRYFQRPEIDLGGPGPDATSISTDPTPAGFPETSDRSEPSVSDETSAYFDENRPLPDLEESDDMLRQTFAAEDPYSRSLLERDHIIRKLVAAVDLVWSKKNPARHFGFWSLAAAYKTETHEGKTLASPLNYQRYDLPVQSLEKLDLALLGKTYRRLKPLFEAAFDELGNEHARWENRALEVADQLTGYQVPSEPVEVIGQDRIYIYADPKLEALPPAHKLLLRMGPAHAERVQKIIEQFKPYLREPEPDAPDETPE